MTTCMGMPAPARASFLVVRTPLCELLAIDAPVIQASIGPWTSAELSAAVCEAGGLGSLGTALRSADQVRADMARMRELTDRPFAVNHTVRPFDEAAFAAALEEPPAVVSLAIGRSAELVDRVHAAGALFMQQVHTVEQAREAADLGADVIIAQGGEAGGFGGFVSTMALVPQVVDAVSPVPVVAAGGIADGRGLAAALALGAQGVNIGTRFLACEETAIGEAWKRAIVDADSEDAVKVEFADAVFPPATPGGYATLPRTLRTSFVDEWNARPDDARREGARLGAELIAAARAGRADELVPFAGQTAGMIHDVLPAAEIVAGMVREAERALGPAAAR
jgi:nitronate monooxygenase/enoyl-[acyl-carrier protein] reductase II